MSPPPPHRYFLKARQRDCGPEFLLWRWVPTRCQHCCLPSWDLAWLQHHHSLSYLVLDTHTHTHTHTYTHTQLWHCSRCTSVLCSSLNMPFQLHYYFLQALNLCGLLSVCFQALWSLWNLRRRQLWRYCCRWQLASHIIGLSTCHSLSLMFPLVQNTGLGKRNPQLHL